MVKAFIFPKRLSLYIPKAHITPIKFTKRMKFHKIALSICAMLAAVTSFSQEARTRIRIAAANSAAADKESADVVCEGYHDEIAIQKALESLGGCGRIELACGDYIVDGFSIAEDGSGYAIRTGYDSNIWIEGDMPNWNGSGVRIMVSSECYESLSDEVIYSVIGATSGDYFQTMSQNLELRNLAVYLPGNQKRIICLDGYNTGRMSAIRCNCRGPKNNRDTDITLGVMDCVGIRGLKGSNNGTATEFSHCTVIGLGVGFALSGEHLVLVSSTSIGCTYGFTFNQYPNNFQGTAQVHPITLIGCHDEVSANYPKFFDNPLGQSIRFINYAVEHYPANLALGGDYATETTPGQWHGIIDYAIQNFNHGDEWIQNSPSLPFWAPGSGISVESHNNTHKSVVSSAERKAYAPNLGQTVFDTDLGKTLTCIDPANKLWVDARGKKVK